MNGQGIKALQDLRNEVTNLVRRAGEIEKSMQALCDHKSPTGEWAVYTGFPVAEGEEECLYCGLYASYIEGWQPPYKLKHLDEKKMQENLLKTVPSLTKDDEPRCTGVLVHSEFERCPRCDK